MEHAGNLSPDDNGLFAHRMHGSCKCGTQHGPPKHTNSKQIDATYDYKDEGGRLLYQVVRFAHKQFRQRRPDPDVPGEWIWKLGDVRRVLYRLPELIAAMAERPGECVYVVEGEKDVDALWRAGAIATCNPHGAGKWKSVAKDAARELKGREVIVIADADEPGRKHAREVSVALKGSRVIELEQKDVGEFLLTGGSVDQLSQIASAPPPPIDLGAAREKKNAAVVVHQGGLTDVFLCPRREKECADATIRELANKAAGLYQRAGMLVRVTREEPPNGEGPQSASAPRIGAMPQPALRELVDKSVRVIEATKAGELKHAHPPPWFIDQIDSRGEWRGIRRLDAVTQSPVMRPDGTVLTTPGYDAETGLLYEPNFTPLDVRECPTRDDALAALEELKDVVCDFPFVAEKHLAGYLALLLTPFARFAFRGPAPLGVLDGSVAGVGKGKLVQVISVLVDGCEMSPTPQPEEPEEERKLITSIAIAGRRMALIDNATKPIGSGALEAVLTSTRWSDRVLGASKTFDGDVLTQWLVTGNNVQFRKKDTIRRCVHVRVEAKTDAPEARSNWTHDPLLEWVRQERPRLVRAALTILRAHAIAGYPNPCTSQWGSFEGWSDRVRASLVWLGMADPADTRIELNATADTEGAALTVVLDALRRAQALNGGGLSARELLDQARSSDDLKDAIDELCPTRRGDVTPKALGKNLRGVKGRVVDVDGELLALSSAPGPGHSLLWCAVAPA